ncbi:MAG: hypothetical protein AAGG69_06465 [Pseudomonadota bacterium]
MTRYQKFLMVLGGIAAVTLLVPSISFTAFVSIIGVPVAVAMWVALALFWVLIIAYGLYRLLPGKNRVTAGLSFVLTLVLLAAVPFVLNRFVDGRTQQFLVDDINAVQQPVDARVLVLRERYLRRADEACGNVCLHALLSGTAQRVIQVDSDRPRAASFGDEVGTAFYMERRDACPDAALSADGARIPQSGGKSSSYSAAADLMKLRISQGQCLISEPASARDATLIATRGRLDVGQVGGGFGFSSRSHLASRTTAAIEDRTSDKGRKIYQLTKIEARRFGPILLPVPEMESLNDYGFGWLRLPKYINRVRYESDLAYGRVLTQTLGLDLNLPANGEGVRDDVLHLVEQLLEADRSPNQAQWSAISAHFENTHKLDRRSRDLAVQMLASERFPIVPRIQNVWFGEANPSAVVDVLLTKIERGPTWPDGLGEPWADTLRRVGVGIAKLPDAGVEGQFQRMNALAQREEVRANASGIILKLRAFGAAGVPTLVASMRYGLTGGEAFFRQDEFSNPFIGGLWGLCIAGAQASTALPDLIAMAERDNFPRFGSYGALLAKTLLRLGDDEERVFGEFFADATGVSDPRAQFDRIVERARKDSSACYL